MKLTKRKAFNFLRSYYDVYNKLQTNEDKLSFLDAILNKQFLNEDPKPLKFPVDLAYDSQVNAIDGSVKGWIRANNTDLQGKTLNTPPTPPKGKTHSDPKEEEEKEKEKEEEKVKVKVKDKGQRADDFKKSLYKYSNSYSGKDKAKVTYPNEMVKSFFEYWTESGDNDIKLKFEKEKTFGSSARLSRWSKNNFNNQKQDLAKPPKIKVYVD
jgi:hypothetical protein